MCFLENKILGVFRNSGLLYWNIYGNDRVSGRLEYTQPEEGEEEGAGAPQKLFYLKDHLGSTRAVVNSSGTVVEAHDYYPFGLLMPGRDYQSGSETKEKFTGKERDAETGLDYVGARYYWAAGGRWWSVDPLDYLTSDKTPYHYASNNPINRVDPNGQIDYEKVAKMILSNVRVSVGTGVGVGAKLEIPYAGSIGAEASLFSADISSTLTGNLKAQGQVLSVNGGLNFLGSDIVSGKIALVQGSIESTGEATGELFASGFKSELKAGTKNKTEQQKMKIKIKGGKIKADKRFKKSGNLGISTKIGVLNASIIIDIRGIISELYKNSSLILNDKSSQETNEDRTKERDEEDDKD